MVWFGSPKDRQGGGGKELLDDPVVKQGIVLGFIDDQVFNLRKLGKPFNFSPEIKEGSQVFVEQVIGASVFRTAWRRRLRVAGGNRPAAILASSSWLRKSSR